MGKQLIIKGADFFQNALDVLTQQVWSDNLFLWGKGGINAPGVSSGSTNDSMSNIGLPFQYAHTSLHIKVEGGYVLTAIATSSYPRPTGSEGGQWHYLPGLNVDRYVIPQGTYYELQLKTISGENADISDGPSCVKLLTMQDELLGVTIAGWPTASNGFDNNTEYGADSVLFKVTPGESIQVTTENQLGAVFGFISEYPANKGMYSYVDINRHQISPSSPYSGEVPSGANYLVVCRRNPSNPVDSRIVFPSTITVGNNFVDASRYNYGS